MIILKVTKNHGFTLSLEENPQEEGAGRGGLELKTSIVKENVRLNFRLKNRWNKNLSFRRNEV